MRHRWHQCMVKYSQSFSQTAYRPAHCDYQSVANGYKMLTACLMYIHDPMIHEHLGNGTYRNTIINPLLISIQKLARYDWSNSYSNIGYCMCLPIIYTNTIKTWDHGLMLIIVNITEQWTMIIIGITNSCSVDVNTYHDIDVWCCV